MVCGIKRARSDNQASIRALRRSQRDDVQADSRDCEVVDTIIQSGKNRAEGESQALKRAGSYSGGLARRRRVKPPIVCCGYWHGESEASTRIG